MSIGEQIDLPAAYVLEEIGDVECLRTRAKEVARDGAEEATLLIATNVINGRGLNDKTWIGFDGNFHVSLILEPEVDSERFHEMLFVGLVSLGNSLATHVAPMTSMTYRWPNDIYIAGHKIGSVWLDKEFAAGSPRLALTMSINLMHAPGDESGDFSLPTMSVREAEGNSDLTVPVLLETWARQFIAEINDWDARGFEHTLAHWQVREEKKSLVLPGVGEEVSIVGVVADGSARISSTVSDSKRQLSVSEYLNW